jgi:hypothetical protein
MHTTHAFCRENGTIVTIGMACVRKTYTQDNRISRVRHLRNIYEALERKKVPNVDSLYLTHENHPTLGCVAFLSPRGINKPPTTGDEVTQAILCILNALIVCTLPFKTSSCVLKQWSRSCTLNQSHYSTGIYGGPT